MREQRRLHRGARRPRLLLAALACLLTAAALAPPSALAFGESYGGGAICGNNCYVQSASAHTFIYNEGASLEGSPALACQLFNSKGANEVTHGSGFCSVTYFGGQFVWARVYNQSGSTFRVAGFAET
jgi:hypothetical protein